MQSRKEESWEVFFLPEMALRSLKTARGSERGDRLEQVACQVADLALEMTEDALREASMYLRRCDSDWCATERALRRSRTAYSASWDHQASPDILLAPASLAPHRHSQWGARDAGANKISGEERLPVEW